jgi:PAS domain S-box-containing protein
VIEDSKKTKAELIKELEILRLENDNLRKSKSHPETQSVPVVLKKIKNEYEKIFGLSLDMICIADLKSETYEKVNPAFGNVLGFTPEEIEGKPYLDFLHPDDIKRTGAIVEEQLRNGKKVLNFQNRHRCKNGEYKWLQWNTHPDLKEFKNYAVARDITEQKRNQEIIFQTEKMHSVGVLAAGMAHEINNPLAGIVNSAQVLISRLNANTPKNIESARKCGLNMDNLQKYIKNRKLTELSTGIQEMGIRAAKIMSIVLSFLNVQEERHVPCDIPLLMDEVIQKLKGNYIPYCNNDLLHIKCNYDTDLPIILCDKKEILQAFYNLLENCLQNIAFENETEKLTITIEMRRDDNGLNIKIEDDGPGMSQEVLSRIFEPFFTTREVDKGKGLGLAITYFVITAKHSGTIEAYSELNNGSTFMIHLPNKKKKTTLA